jgi:hypothetical protein
MIYLKLALMSMLFFSMHLALPWTVATFQEVWLTARCGVAGWTDDHEMFERLIEEEWGRLRLREAAIRLSRRRAREDGSRSTEPMYAGGRDRVSREGADGDHD